MLKQWMRFSTGGVSLYREGSYTAILDMSKISEYPHIIFDVELLRGLVQPKAKMNAAHYRDIYIKCSDPPEGLI